MSTENSQQRVSWPVAFGQAPKDGSRAMYQLLNFSLENPVGINLQYEQDSDRIEYVQSLYVDNSLNPAAITFTMRGTQQQITIPAASQAYIPVMATSDSCKMSVSTSGTINIPIQFLSFPIPAIIWQVGGSSSGGSTGTDWSANKPSLLANLLLTIPVNAGRSKVEIENQSAGQIQVVLDDGAGANISILLLAAGGANIQGASWWDTTFKGRVRVFATNTTDQVMARES